MSKSLKDRVKSVNYKLETLMTRDLAKNWRHISTDDVNTFSRFLIDNSESPREYWETDQGAEDLKGHAIERLESDRRTYLPWLNSLKPLADSSVLEIGFGTGCATVALAEQGAHVTGLDIEPSKLTVATERCRLYGVEADLHIGDDMQRIFDGQSFDFVIFFASLEHMTMDERLSNLSAAFNLTKPGGWLVVIEAPNRLWYEDVHTSWLPFFDWLPDELALEYLKYSPREVLQQLATKSDDNLLELKRWGRGASFHEFDLALGPDAKNAVGPSLDEYLRGRSPLRWLQGVLSPQARYRWFIKGLADVPACWFERYLNVAIRR
jgi:2-polyprenyl-3-methyl-5-hydroxy-6-metoxy-1,4-benzoquinol methylase